MFARTPRLTLRPGWPEDAPALAQAVAHEAVAMNLASLPWPYLPEHAAQWLARPRTVTEPAFLILAHDGAYPRLIGTIGLSSTDGETEIGYWLTPNAWGHGYATEAGGAVLRIARHALGLKRVVAGHFADNPASGRVLRKLGFREAGQAPRYSVARGHAAECVLFERDLDEPERMADFKLAA